MSLKGNIITGFVFYWVYQFYRHRGRRNQATPFDKFRFPDF
jgi:hypothetical protein